MSTGPASILEARALHFTRRQGWRRHAEVLSGTSLALHPGELLALLGANGAGKSTLLRLLLGLLVAERGDVLLDGRPLAAWPRREVARRIAYVPQLHTPPFPYAVRDVVALGGLPHRRFLQGSQPRERARVDVALQQLDLGALANRPYTALSGGERQRVLIARALVQDAAVLVFDEPANNLDYGHQLRLLDQLRALADKGYAVLFTTHHPDQARAVADRVALLDHGRITADGPPAQVLTAEVLAALYGLHETESTKTTTRPVECR
ncbi:ABC transporter ATP-binding protein [Variovorax ginsengisoli]|uniref:Iron complex transport system ATP-binding protein n=1 Tax=Variovorax ginsengisoli TaxID=363844 RepID=A0ABT9SH54_9BURK|nr:ABC transporter ATP-binding protein [Variovorax ginsengisoli]MDP9902722.1 iron complex transport system ATP-binding protein [Variovorax ginsengisoli]